SSSGREGGWKGQRRNRAVPGHADRRRYFGPIREVLGRLRRQMGNRSVPEVVALAKQVITQAEFIEKAEERVVGKSGFMPFHDIDHGGWLPRFGINRRTVRWILGNPLIAITMIRLDRRLKEDTQ